MVGGPAEDATHQILRSSSTTECLHIRHMTFIVLFRLKTQQKERKKSAHLEDATHQIPKF